MGIDKELNILHLVEKSQRNTEWYEKVRSLNNHYKNELNQIQFGKFITKTNKDSIDLIKNAFKESRINNIEYINFKLNQHLLIEREKHPVIYFLDNGKSIYFITNTNSAANFKMPIKDCMEFSIVKEHITVSTLLNKNAYLSNATYIVDLKNEIEFKNVLINIENDELKMNNYFNNKELRFLQKEKAFEIFYKTIFKQESEILSYDTTNINTNEVKSVLVDVTFDKYTWDLSAKCKEIKVFDIIENKEFYEPFYLYANIASMTKYRTACIDFANYKNIEDYSEKFLSNLILLNKKFKQFYGLEVDFERANEPCSDLEQKILNKLIYYKNHFIEEWKVSKQDSVDLANFKRLKNLNEYVTSKLK